MQNKEYQLCKSITDYLKMQYPKVLYHVDILGSNLSKATAGLNKAVQGQRGWCDFFIAEPVYDSEGNVICGLFLELKKETPFCKDGTLKKQLVKTYKNTKQGRICISEHDHLAEQQKMIDDLRERGYAAYFCFSFDMAKDIIDNYLKQ